MPTTEQTLAKLSGAKIMSKLDANSGFWQRKLSENSKLVTTFITPWGRYCFTRLPFGISSAPEHFQKAMQRILEGLDGVECQVDDILVFGETQEQHDKRLIAVLERVADASVTLNLEKCKFSTDKVEFLGHVIGKDGVQIDPTKVEAVTQMGEPTDIAQLRRFLGMVNQVGKCIPNLADITKPLRVLLSKSNAWLWTEAQQKVFDDVKKALVLIVCMKVIRVSQNVAAVPRCLCGGQALVGRLRIWFRDRTFRAEPLISSVVPDRPWQIMGTDLLQLKSRTYLLVADYFSRYIELALLLSSQTSQDVIQALKSMFARRGIPDSVRSDNGPQYSSAEFIKFAKEWGFASVTSSPKHPQSNGMAERAVQTAKSVLKKEDDPPKALLAYRSTPLENGYSSAELLFGR